MKVYSASYMNNNGHYQQWFPSLKAAHKEIAEWQKEDDIISAFDPIKHDVPGTRNALIDWLNGQCNNGESAL